MERKIIEIYIKGETEENYSIYLKKVENTKETNEILRDLVLLFKIKEELYKEDKKKKGR